jgi:hypothetical protein
MGLEAITICKMPGKGPEDVLPLPNGAFVTGLEDGRIILINKDFASCSELVNTGGRPLGLEICPSGELIICDAEKGLLRFSFDSKKIENLSEKSDIDVPFCNNCAVSNSGAIFFSSSTARFKIGDSSKDVSEGIPSGVLLKWSPNGEIEKLMDGLYFANGVVLSPDEKFVLVAETGRARISRYWLAGKLKGTRDVFCKNLPGLPDNINLGTDHLVWVAMVLSAAPIIWKIWAAPYFLRWLYARAPKFVKGRQEKIIRIMALDFHGEVKCEISLESDKYDFVTSVRERNGYLCLGSINQESVARINL